MTEEIRTEDIDLEEDFGDDFGDDDLGPGEIPEEARKENDDE
jgi:hypothetical protein